MPDASLGDALRRVVFQRSFEHRTCTHLDTARLTAPLPGPCPDCVAEGTRTVHLRMCLTCGNVGCCDSSTGLHARRHFKQTGHPLMRSVEPGERWAWCYIDRAYLNEPPTDAG